MIENDFLTALGFLAVIFFLATLARSVNDVSGVASGMSAIAGFFILSYFPTLGLCDGKNLPKCDDMKVAE